MLVFILEILLLHAFFCLFLIYLCYFHSHSARRSFLLEVIVWDPWFSWSLLGPDIGGLNIYLGYYSVGWFSYFHFFSSFNFPYCRASFSLNTFLNEITTILVYLLLFFLFRLNTTQCAVVQLLLCLTLLSFYRFLALYLSFDWNYRRLLRHIQGLHSLYLCVTWLPWRLFA